MNRDKKRASKFHRFLKHAPGNAVTCITVRVTATGYGFCWQEHLSAFIGSTTMGQAKPTILVVEDEPLLRMYAADLLEENGFGVVEAANADAALKLLETRDDVRLLFTDVRMPGSCNGMDLARQVHARWPHILLVITSGHLRPAEEEIPDHGHFIAKPYRATELLGEVNDMMRKA